MATAAWTKEGRRVQRDCSAVHRGCRQQQKQRKRSLSSDERELGPGPGQKQPGEENRSDAKMRTDVEWIDDGSPWLFHEREGGRKREIEREVKDDIFSSSFNWTVTPLTEAENTEK